MARGENPLSDGDGRRRTDAQRVDTLAIPSEEGYGDRRLLESNPSIENGPEPTSTSVTKHAK